MSIEAKWSDFSSLDRERTFAAASQLLPKWVTLVLVVVIAWQLAQIIWMLMPGSVAGDPLEVQPAQLDAAISGPPARGQANVQAIATTHLFGKASEEAVPAAPEEITEDLTEYSGSLTLMGSIASDDQQSSVAIISDQGNVQESYVVGEMVAPGTTLHAIYADRVVLNRNGTLEVLKLPTDESKGSQPARRSTASVTRTTTSNTRSIQNVVSQNATKLADVIRPTPYFVGGQQQGYRVYPGRDRRQFAALGLRPGDLIKDIDGAALTDPQQAMQIFNNLGNAEQVSVTVERNGKPEVLVLRTSMLNLDNTQ